MIRKDDWSTMRRLLLTRGAAGGALKEYEAEGNPAVFETNVAKPLAGFTIPFYPIQAGTGDPSPQNQRPIIGRQGLTAWRTGGNLLDPSFAISTQSHNGYVNADGSLTITARDGTGAKSRGHITLPPGTYDFYSDFGSGYQSRYTINDSTSETVFVGKNTVTITEQTDFYFKAAMGTNYPVTGWLQIFKSGAEYTEQKYQGASYPVTFPDGQTVYGGTLDAVNGVLTVEYMGVTAKWSEFEAKQSLGDYTTGRYNISNYPSTQGGRGGKCNIAPRAWESSDTLHYYTEGNSLKIYLPNDTDGDTEIQVVYPLATPFEIPLSDIPVPVTLIGDNTIWTDTDGSNTIKYKKKG